MYEYRDKRDDETSFEYGQRIANELETKILELGEKNVAAFVAETVVGATSGALTAPEGYFKRIRQICDQYDVLLILDEIMCGMGRTGVLHACEDEGEEGHKNKGGNKGIQGDLQTIAKGIAAGYQPLGAVLIGKKIVDGIESGSGFFQHGHTYIGHATACAAGLATQLEIQEKNLLSNVKKQGENLKQQLKESFANVPELNQHIGDIRGRGLFIGVELVANKENKRPFDPKLKLHAQIKKQAMQNGLMVYPMGGTIDGVNGDHILIAPPFIINEGNVAQIAERLSKTLQEVICTKVICTKQAKSGGVFI